MSNTFHLHLSPRLCPSTAGCSHPSMSSTALCLLLSCSRWFPHSLLCRLAIFYLVVPLILFHLSPSLYPSIAGCSPPSMPPIVLCLLLSCSRWFPPSLLCRLAIFWLVVLLISSLSLVATLCSVWSFPMMGFWPTINALARWIVDSFFFHLRYPSGC